MLLEDGEDVLEEIELQCQCGSPLLALAQTACAVAHLRKEGGQSAEPQWRQIVAVDDERLPRSARRWG